MLGVAIIGCGLIGKKRLQALGKNAKLIACVDLDINRAKDLAKAADYRDKSPLAFVDWKEIFSLKGIDIVIISTLHNSLAEISLECMRAGKHILVEKPAARFSDELLPLIMAEKEFKIKAHVGFNHRYHRALRKAKELVKAGEIGELMFLRGRYGHGARIGYESEWRSNPKLSGGGELIDQGPHLVDLSRWFLGDMTNINGYAHTYYWDMPVDDNGFMLLRTKTNQVAFLHVSCTEWKNLFSMEIYGKKGKLEISGLGGSYGLEKLTFYRMLPEMGPPETTAWEFPMSDDSWDIEFEEFVNDIRLDRRPQSTLSDAYEALKIIEKIYKDSGYDYRA